MAAALTLGVALVISVTHVVLAWRARSSGRNVPFWSLAQHVVATGGVVLGVVAARAIRFGSWTLPEPPGTVLTVCLVLGYAAWAVSVWVSDAMRGEDLRSLVVRVLAGCATGTILGSTLTHW
ncbi:hypothetical protein SAMN05445756_1160 [Kytococcus aerolatus]|uniref:Uncharacterized protein n=1 Tax=Kytococcus aerolatus TaxID=592308 RepID=A0A212TFS3_9MICO|nr:hypothetical protein [Kytococcus aerolatus]SNC64676.1 hypothetical protein SAMN05445756_1160 [Kytococcus aerolatus]